MHPRWHCGRGEAADGRVGGGSALEGFTTVGTVAVESREGGGCEITRRVEDAKKRVCRVTDRFTPTQSSIRWEMEVVSDAQALDVPLELGLKMEAKPSTRFWTAWVNGTLWSNNSVMSKQDDLALKIPDGTNWCDPLVPMALMDRTWNYGNGRGSICIPIASVLEPKEDTGLSLVLSPEQPLLLAQLSSNPEGTVLFRQTSPAGRRQESEVHCRYRCALGRLARRVALDGGPLPGLLQPAQSQGG